VSDSEAVVARLEGEHAWLEVCKPSVCGSCASAEACGGRPDKKRLQRVRNTIGANVGDAVIVTVADGAVLKAALWSYLMPLLLALVGAAVGTALAGDVAALVGTVSGLTIGLALLRVVGAQLASRREPLLAIRIKSAVVQLHRNEES
jgi:sigma-E factor negative regulatory protein RseC